MAKLILIRGLPGSGKSTMAKEVYYSHIHLEADMYHVKNGVYQFDPSKIKEAHEWCQKTCRILLDNGKDVVVSNTFTQKWELTPYLEMTKDCVVITLTGNYGSIHNVPEAAIMKMKERWED